MFWPEGSKARLAVFNGQGKRTSDDDEKMAWHPDVNVFSQQHARVYQYICIKWGKKPLLPFLNGQDLSKFVLVVNNLKGQMQDDIRSQFPALMGCCGMVYQMILIYGNPLMLHMLPA